MTDDELDDAALAKILRRFAEGDEEFGTGEAEKELIRRGFIGPRPQFGPPPVTKEGLEFLRGQGQPPDDDSEH